MRAAVLGLLVLLACPNGAGSAHGDVPPFVVVLGVAQDGGRPQAGCRKPCCAAAWSDPGARRRVACLGIVDPESGERWLVDATPDFREQLRLLDGSSAAPLTSPQGAPPPDVPLGLAGILLTHAHIGHYAGLVHLGREVLGAARVPVFAMPRLAGFLRANGPWAQLVDLENIALRQLQDGVRVQLNRRIAVTPFLVPHRDEYSETVGFRIDGPERSVVYIPDIDKWERWTMRIEAVLASADVAYLDGTFYAGGELPNRDMAEIPHPFIVESMRRLATLPARERAKVRFVHLNHTNPALDPGSEAHRAIEAAGFRVAAAGEKVEI